MSEMNRKIYRAGIETKRIRDELELAIDTDFFDEVFETFSNMERGVFVLKELGFSNGWITRHFEFSRQRTNEILDGIRKKLLKFNFNN